MRDIRQAAFQPPMLRSLVVAPDLMVDDGAFALGIAVDQADLYDLAHLVIAHGYRAGAFVVFAHTHLVEAIQIQRARRVFLEHLGVDVLRGALDIAPTDDVGVGRERGGQGVAFFAGGTAAEKQCGQHDKQTRDARHGEVPHLKRGPFCRKLALLVRAQRRTALGYEAGC